jgi:hypothetical protein
MLKGNCLQKSYPPVNYPPVKGDSISTCVDCEQVASVGSGFGILCKNCVVEKYRRYSEIHRSYNCSNNNCKKTIDLNSRYATILKAGQPSYHIENNGGVYVHMFCPMCEYGNGAIVLKNYKNSHKERETIMVKPINTWKKTENSPKSQITSIIENMILKGEIKLFK